MNSERPYIDRIRTEPELQIQYPAFPASNDKGPMLVVADKHYEDPHRSQLTMGTFINYRSALYSVSHHYGHWNVSTSPTYNDGPSSMGSSMQVLESWLKGGHDGRLVRMVRDLIAYTEANGIPGGFPPKKPAK